MAQSEKYGQADIPGIPDDEPVFILRAQDCFAERLVIVHATLVKSAGKDKMATDDFMVAQRFHNWPVKKIPD